MKEYGGNAVQRCRCIRCREISRQGAWRPHNWVLGDFTYYPADAEEHFISFSTADDQLAGYLRLSLPVESMPANRARICAQACTKMPELRRSALIPQVHIYGQSLEVGQRANRRRAAQRVGNCPCSKKQPGSRSPKGYARLAVIAAIGTSLYYESAVLKKITCHDQKFDLKSCH